MPAIVSRSRPRCAAQPMRDSQSTFHLDDSEYAASRYASPPTMPASLLQSPIRLKPSVREPAFKSKSSCSLSAKRRAAVHRHPYSHPPRNDCPFESTPNFFEQVPWISALETTPEQLCWEVSDISQLAEPELSKRTLPRASQTATPRTTPRKITVADDEPGLLGHIPFPFSADRCYSPRPSRIHHSKILFKHLMPTYPSFDL